MGPKRVGDLFSGRGTSKLRIQFFALSLSSSLLVAASKLPCDFDCEMGASGKKDPKRSSLGAEAAEAPETAGSADRE